jgi:hypothetical protein
VFGQKQGRRETAVIVWQCDQHEVAARPDVQRIAGHRKAAGAHRGYGQFLVAVFEIGLARFDETLRAHFAAHCRARAVGCKQRLHRHGEQLVALEIANPRGPRGKIGRLEAMLEMHLYAGSACRNFEQHLVEPMTRNRKDHFIGPLTIGLKRGFPICMVDQPAAHRQHRGPESLQYARDFEGVNSPIGERQIDGTAGCGGHAAQVRPAFIQLHLRGAAPLEQYGQQRAGWARADDAYVSHHPRSARDSAPAAANTSPNELYSGTGASRKMSGSRQSPITPPSRSSRS